MPTTTKLVSFLAMMLACYGLTVLMTRIVPLPALPGWAMPAFCAVMIVWTSFGRPWRSHPRRYVVIGLWAAVFVLSVLLAMR